jgi:hypothetical protein
MILIDRANGRKYQLVKRFASSKISARYLEATTGRRYNLVKVYL